MPKDSTNTSSLKNLPIRKEVAKIIETIYRRAEEDLIILREFSPNGELNIGYDRPRDEDSDIVYQFYKEIRSKANNIMNFIYAVGKIDQDVAYALVAYGIEK